LKISSIFPKEKCFRYLPYLYHLFARGRATSKHRGGGRYNAILEFKGEQIEIFDEKKKKKMRKRKKEKERKRNKDKKVYV
jgi:hypothetical protein